MPQTRRRLGLLLLGAAIGCAAAAVGYLAHEIAAWLTELLFAVWDWPPRSPRLVLANGEQA